MAMIYINIMANFRFYTANKLLIVINMRHKEGEKWKMSHALETCNMSFKVNLFHLNNFSKSLGLCLHTLFLVCVDLFLKHSCCGVNPVVSTTNDFDQTPWCTTAGSCQATSSQIPRACCINITERTYTSAPASCYASVNPGTYHIKVVYERERERE